MAKKHEPLQVMLRTKTMSISAGIGCLVKLETGVNLFFVKGKSVIACCLSITGQLVSLYDRQNTGNILLPMCQWILFICNTSDSSWFNTNMQTRTYILPMVSCFLLQALQDFTGCYVNQHYDHTNISPCTNIGKGHSIFHS